MTERIPRYFDPEAWASSQEVVPKGDIGLDGNNVLHQPTDTSPHSIEASQKLFSDGPMDLYVDPSSGSDGNDGSQGSPFASLDRAFEELPYILTHKVVIHLADGTYNNEPGSITTKPIMTNHTSDDGDIHIIGNTTNPGNVVLDSCTWITSGVHGSEPTGFLFEGMQINAKVQAYNGIVGLENCILHSDSAIQGAQAALAGYASFASISNCTIGGDADYVVAMTQGGFVDISSCDGEPNTAWVQTGQRTNVYVSIMYTGTTAPYVSDATKPGIVIHGGDLVHPNVP